MNPIERFGTPSTLAASVLLGGHVPRWVPLGFGVARKFQRGQIGPNGYIKWTDDACSRAIWLDFTSGTPRQEHGVRFGRWTVTVPAPGGLTYVAVASNGTVLLNSYGVSRAAMNRVVNSVPL